LIALARDCAPDRRCANSQPHTRAPKDTATDYVLNVAPAASHLA
jgi:hypothetical protein